MFYKLSEHNGWEGETWHFYIPVDGNEDSWAELQKVYEQYKGENTYVFHQTPIPENEVDILVKHTDSGYMAIQNKVVGKLDILKIKSITKNDLDDEEPLYKGGVRRLME